MIVNLEKDGQLYSAKVEIQFDTRRGQIGCSEFHKDIIYVEGFDWSATQCCRQDAEGNDHDISEADFRSAVGDEVDNIIWERVDSGNWE